MEAEVSKNQISDHAPKPTFDALLLSAMPIQGQL